MSEFWIGASAATTVWLLVYGLAVAFWLWRDIHVRAAEMGCTEAANDRVDDFRAPAQGIYESL